MGTMIVAVVLAVAAVVVSSAPPYSQQQHNGCLCLFVFVWVPFTLILMSVIVFFCDPPHST